MIECKNCWLYYKDEGEKYPVCHFEDDWSSVPPCELEDEPSPRYTVVYNGYLFDGDEDGPNYHDYERFEDALAVYHAYPDMVTIIDNEDGMYFNGEWY